MDDRYLLRFAASHSIQQQFRQILQQFSPLIRQDWTDTPQTLKAPSDSEDGGIGGGGGVGDPDLGISITQKMPSDSEDGGSTTIDDNPDGGDSGISGNDGVGTVQTMRFPSDSESGGDGSLGRQILGNP
ncbi:MAG: hypothetical protein SFZ03_07925 [Candidatus Melainabacteria bacterium]|nr:hypothetical protein [Candidatus Melainabacteria bacterium]